LATALRGRGCVSVFRRHRAVSLTQAPRRCSVRSLQDHPISVLPPDLEPNEACRLPDVSAELVEDLLTVLLELSSRLESQRVVLPPEHCCARPVVRHPVLSSLVPDLTVVRQSRGEGHPRIGAEVGVESTGYDGQCAGIL
jgi:hypothetical protein